MKPLVPLFLSLALAAPAPALAQASPPAPANPFAGLWTGWDAANREAVAAETRAADRVRAELAEAERARALREEGRALGERVGEIVRLGDCAEGERMAREAGDFPLVAAVRSHCAVPGTARASSRRGGL